MAVGLGFGFFPPKVQTSLPVLLSQTCQSEVFHSFHIPRRGSANTHKRSADLTVSGTRIRLARARGVMFHSQRTLLAQSEKSVLPSVEKDNPEIGPLWPVGSTFALPL